MAPRPPLSAGDYDVIIPSWVDPGTYVIQVVLFETGSPANCSDPFEIYGDGPPATTPAPSDVPATATLQTPSPAGSPSLVQTLSPVRATTPLPTPAPLQHPTPTPTRAPTHVPTPVPTPVPIPIPTQVSIQTPAPTARNFIPTSTTSPPGVAMVTPQPGSSAADLGSDSSASGDEIFLPMAENATYAPPFCHSLLAPSLGMFRSKASAWLPFYRGRGKEAETGGGSTSLTELDSRASGIETENNLAWRIQFDASPYRSLHPGGQIRSIVPCLSHCEDSLCSTVQVDVSIEAYSDYGGLYEELGTAEGKPRFVRQDNVAVLQYVVDDGEGCWKLAGLQTTFSVRTTRIGVPLSPARPDDPQAGTALIGSSSRADDRSIEKTATRAHRLRWDGESRAPDAHAVCAYVDPYRQRLFQQKAVLLSGRFRRGDATALVIQASFATRSTWCCVVRARGYNNARETYEVSPKEPLAVNRISERKRGNSLFAQVVSDADHPTEIVCTNSEQCWYEETSSGQQEASVDIYCSTTVAYSAASSYSMTNVPSGAPGTPSPNTAPLATSSGDNPCSESTCIAVSAGASGGRVVGALAGIYAASHDSRAARTSFLEVALSMSSCAALGAPHSITPDAMFRSVLFACEGSSNCTILEVETPDVSSSNYTGVYEELGTAAGKPRFVRLDNQAVLQCSEFDDVEYWMLSGLTTTFSVSAAVGTPTGQASCRSSPLPWRRA